jgi:hypothetical protein
MWRQIGPTDLHTVAVIVLAGLFTYSARLTSIVLGSAHVERALLITAASLAPVVVINRPQCAAGSGRLATTRWIPPWQCVKGVKPG